MVTGKVRSLLLWAVLAVLGAMANAQEILYGTDGAYGSNRLATIDPATGVVTYIGPTGAPDLRSICADVAGDRLLAGQHSPGAVPPNTLYAVDRATGVASAIGSTAVHNMISGLALRATDGALFAVDMEFLSFRTFNTATGLQSLVGPITTYSWSLGISPAGTLYSGTWASVPADIRTVNPSNGVTTSLTGGVGVSFIGFVPTGPDIIGLSFRSDGVLYAVVRHGATYTLGTVNTTTGAITRVATLSGTVISIAWFEPAPTAAAGPALPAIPRGSKGKGGRGCFVTHASQANLGGIAALLALVLVGVTWGVRRRLAR